jgi:polyphosphate glucokinase
MNYTNTQLLGIDIGGSGIKGSIVETKSGEMLSERLRIETPANATPTDIAEIIKKITENFSYKGIIGCGFPAVIQNGIIKTAANISKKNIDTDANALFSKITGNNVYVWNDADCAGYASVKFGVGKGVKGVILLLTVGTGIGSALFIDGHLVPNTELGHLVLPKQNIIAEKYTSDFIRKEKNLDWNEWGKRFNGYLQYVEFLFNPDLIIIGGGASKKFENYSKSISIKTKIVPEILQNNAGIIGAATLVYNKIF